MTQINQMIGINVNGQTFLIAALVWLLICAFRGYQKGFLREIYTLAEILLALVFLWLLSEHLLFLARGAQYLGGFLVVWFVLHWIGKFLDLINYIPLLGGLNRTLGVLLGFFVGLLILGLIYTQIIK
jgi:uncharacterized membrane protein required for colicin V production